MADNFNQYRVFQNLPDDAKARVRAKVAEQRVLCDAVDLAEVRSRVAAATENACGSMVSGSPLERETEFTQFGIADSETADLARNFENLHRRTESLVEHYYELHPKLVWFHLLQGADARLRELVEHVVAGFDCFFGDTGPGAIGGSGQGRFDTETHADIWAQFFGPDEFGYREPIPAPIIVYASSRPREQFLLHGGLSISDVYETVKNDAHCDLQMFGHLCDENLRRIAQSAPYSISERVSTFPVARGDLIILMRFCSDCAKKFLNQNKIDSKKCKIQESYNDGFGSVGWPARPNPTVPQRD